MSGIGFPGLTSLSGGGSLDLGSSAESGPLSSVSNPIFTITPQALNLGEILQAMSGPPENGGSGLSASNLGYTGLKTQNLELGKSGGISTTTIAILAVVGVVGLAFALR